MGSIGTFLKDNALFLGFIAVLALAYLWLRQGPSTISSTEEFDAALASGQPVLAVFVSDT